MQEKPPTPEAPLPGRGPADPSGWHVSICLSLTPHGPGTSNAGTSNEDRAASSCLSLQPAQQLQPPKFSNSSFLFRASPALGFLLGAGSDEPSPGGQEGPSPPGQARSRDLCGLPGSQSGGSVTGADSSVLASTPPAAFLHKSLAVWINSSSLSSSGKRQRAVKTLPFISNKTLYMWLGIMLILRTA